MTSPDDRGSGPSAEFRSILFDRDAAAIDAVPRVPEFFADLHLDQVVASLTAGREEYELAPFFYWPLHSIEAVQYRHHVLNELETGPVLEAVSMFADGMRRMRKHLGLMNNLHYARQKQRWFLEAGSVYCSTVTAFADRLAELDLRSRGFVGMREYLTAYTASEIFTSLLSDTREVEGSLARVTYAVQIRGNRVRVSRYEDEPDMSEEIEHAFAKFKEGAVTDYRVRISEWGT